MKMIFAGILILSAFAQAETSDRVITVFDNRLSRALFASLGGDVNGDREAVVQAKNVSCDQHEESQFPDPGAKAEILVYTTCTFRNAKMERVRLEGTAGNAFFRNLALAKVRPKVMGTKTNPFRVIKAHLVEVKKEVSKESGDPGLPMEKIVYYEATITR